MQIIVKVQNHQRHDTGFVSYLQVLRISLRTMKLIEIALPLLVRGWNLISDEFRGHSDQI